MTGRDDQSRDAREDAEWRAIVDNFGDRVDLPDAEPELALTAAEPVEELPAELASLPWEDEGHFVPPDPPPVPRPTPARLAAWFGLFGVPAIALLCVVTGVSLASELALLGIVWFVGGFGYLVSTMSSRDPDSGWDDGAVL